MKTYTYVCRDCIENSFDSIEELTVEANSKREADKLVLHSNHINTDEPPRPYAWGEGVIETPLGNRAIVGGSKWKHRGHNQWTAEGWVGPYCNYRVQDSEAAQRATNLQGW